MIARWLLLCMIACSEAPVVSKDPPNDPPPVEQDRPLPKNGAFTFSNVTGISVSTGTLDPAFSPLVFEYEVSALHNIEPIDITVTGQDVTIDSAVAKDGVPLAMTVPALDDATSIAIHASLDGAPVTYSIHTVPAERPRFTTTIPGKPKPGLIYVSPYDPHPLSPVPGPFLYILEPDGRMRYYMKVPRSAFGFRPVTLPNGTKRYTYVMSNAGPPGPTMPTTAYVMDEHFRPLKSITMIATTKHAAIPTGPHEFILIDDDHYIVEAYNKETVTNVPNKSSANVIASIVQEVKANDVLLDWDSTTEPSLYADSMYSVPGFGYVDYCHVNSVTIDPSGSALLLSLRNTNSLVAIDRASGNLLWKLGGKTDQFGLTTAQKPSVQHHATYLGKDHVLIFDNGDGVPVQIREYQFDSTAKTITSVTSMTFSSHHSAAMGSVQRIDDVYFIGWGHREQSESDISEVNAVTGEVVFDLSFADGYVSYRALKL